MSRVRIPSLAPILLSWHLVEVSVYALKFESGEIYVGITKNLPRRLAEHRRRQSPSTKRFLGEFTLLHSEPFLSYATARSREVYLKSGAGRAWLKSGASRRETP